MHSCAASSRKHESTRWSRVYVIATETATMMAELHGTYSLLNRTDGDDNDYNFGWLNWFAASSLPGSQLVCTAMVPCLAFPMTFG